MTFSPQIIFQQMLDAHGLISVQSTSPELVIAMPTGDVMEGTLLRAQVQRDNTVLGDCSVDWAVTGPSGDLTAPLAGTAVLASQDKTCDLVVKTVYKTGLQGTPRQATVTLSNPMGCALDPARTVLDIPIRDRVATLPAWYNLPRRSERAWASGTSGLTGTLAVDPNTPVEQSVAFLDGGFGHSRGAGNVNVATWDGVTGGPPGGPLLATGTQFDWSENTGFGLYFQRFPANSAWLIWDMVLFPTSRATNTGDASIWTEIGGGLRDAEYRAMGARIASAFTTKGHNLNRFVGSLHTGMNAGGYAQVFAGTRLAYKAAMERAIDQMRVGAAFPLQFAHCPSMSPNIGLFHDWTPANIGVVGLDYFPDKSVVDLAAVDNYLTGAGLDPRYALRSTLEDAVDRLNVPMMVSRWQVRHEAGFGCPVADLAIQRFYDSFLQPNAARLLFDGLSNLTILNTGGYLDTQPGGSAAWASASGAYKARWAGRNLGNVVVYVPPTVNVSASVASVNEGDT